MNNVKAMLQIITQKYLLDSTHRSNNELATIESIPVPELEVTPDIGLLHPLLVNKESGMKFALNPKECKYCEILDTASNYCFHVSLNHLVSSFIQRLELEAIT